MNTARLPGYWRNILYMFGQEEAEIRADIQRETASVRASTQQAIARSRALLVKAVVDENRCTHPKIC